MVFAIIVINFNMSPTMKQYEHNIACEEDGQKLDKAHNIIYAPSAEIYDINHILQETKPHNLRRLLRKDISENIRNAIAHQLICHAIPKEIFLFNLRDLMTDQNVPKNVKEAAENHIIEQMIPKAATTSDFKELFDNIFSAKVHEAAENHLIDHILPVTNDTAYLKSLYKKIESARACNIIAQKYIALSPYDGFSNKLINRKYAARDKYYRLRPGAITMERMQKNIEGLYAPMIEEIIVYSKRAIAELQLAPEDIYSQRFDKRRYNTLIHSIYLV